MTTPTHPRAALLERAAEARAMQHAPTRTTEYPDPLPLEDRDAIRDLARLVREYNEGLADIERSINKPLPQNSPKVVAAQRAILAWARGEGTAR